MKLLTPERGELMQVTEIRPLGTGLLIQGKIMGAMPMKAVLLPSQMRAGFRLLTLRTIWTLCVMLFRSDGAGTKPR